MKATGRPLGLTTKGSFLKLNNVTEPFNCFLREQNGAVKSSHKLLRRIYNTS
ncbi:hypothetical protein PET01_02530 [Pediococcus ethanolidurans]|nr:hypothetical protein PET01_02530 [Pediococcus ethanolidurans]